SNDGKTLAPRATAAMCHNPCPQQIARAMASTVPSKPHHSGDVRVTPSAGGREVARFLAQTRGFLARTGGRLRGADWPTICLTEIGPFAAEARAGFRLSD